MKKLQQTKEFKQAYNVVLFQFLKKSGIKSFLSIILFIKEKLSYS